MIDIAPYLSDLIVHRRFSSALILLSLFCNKLPSLHQSQSPDFPKENDVSSLFKPAHSHLITLIDTTTLDSK
ncbi:hypothetical protein PGT21_029594 [Puccinia graminis f. sp. tritici]|uniref:Uncharacterized protein n=1 Tax=Puccinia graminis f. sp. tritici TaxID=56615 RepID=A0A5B0PBJ1_PUCGR|nr:hypothetical protein PGT21_029594 [Puccinia graminis f. sp. tritici]